MAQAQVTSVEAIELFRAKFIVFLAQARNVLEEASNEVVRMRPWLQDEKRMFWEQELRRRARKLEEAKQELFNATLSKFHETIALHRMAVQRSDEMQSESSGSVGRKPEGRVLLVRNRPETEATPRSACVLPQPLHLCASFLFFFPAFLQRWQRCHPPYPHEDLQCVYVDGGRGTFSRACKFVLLTDHVTLFFIV